MATRRDLHLCSSSSSVVIWTALLLLFAPCPCRGNESAGTAAAKGGLRKKMNAVAAGVPPPPPPTSTPSPLRVPQRLLVPMTLVHDAAAKGAVCLDGSLPAYHIHKGTGNGARNWILQFEGGGWCEDLDSCLDRAPTRRGSTKYMAKYSIFSGILNNDSNLNPDFYNWNRVKLRYCDGASFGGDSEYHNGNTSLYFRGQRIWDAIIQDLLPRGLASAEKALLSGCSAGGLATFLHCDDFAQRLPKAQVKCLSDAGFFLDVQDITHNDTIRTFFNGVVSLQGVQKNLNEKCLESVDYPFQCFFPQYALPHIETPYFILNSAYDVYQFHHILVPTSADPRGVWARCKLDPAACNPSQITILQGLRTQMLAALKYQENSKGGGLFINSCFAHCQSESQDTWLSPNPPLVNNKMIFEAVGDWYFDREIDKDIDCSYPCDNTCHNLIPAKQ